MAHRRRRRTQQVLSGVLGGGGIMGIAKKVATPVAFIGALTNDIQGDINGQPTIGGKLKTVANALTGRVSNLNLFGDVPKYAMKINPSGMWNPFTQSGVTMLAVGIGSQYLAKALKVPAIGKLGRLKGLGAAMAIGGAAGGLFDDKGQTMQPLSVSGAQTFQNQQVQQQSNLGYNTRQFSYSQMRATSSGNVTADIRGSAF